ncbi:MAG: family 1 glycosylhydrolase, partial [Acidobacteriota bacterium]
LIVGDNVTFTWELPPEPADAMRKLVPDPGKPRALRPPKPHTPQKPGEKGEAGLAGLPARTYSGVDGANAPEIELWTLSIHGAPAFFLDAQDGFAGAEGCDGGAGGDGAKGRNETANLVGVCDLSARPGGDGGKGGAAGEGIRGGDGGKGGQLFLYAPEAVLVAYGSAGFSVSADGGRGGPGGIPGAPGPGGDGGAPGDTIVCIPYPGYQGGPSTKGKDGDQGGRGAAGAQGQPGDSHPAPFHFLPIDVAMFKRKLTDPAIIALTGPSGVALDTVFEGDAISVTGLRFAATDHVEIDGVKVRPGFVDAGHLTFAVPASGAGRRIVQVVRTDGARSNPATLRVGAQIVAPVAGARLRPGTTLEIRGKGFTSDCRVEVNQSAMPDFEFVDAHTIRCRLVRPPNVTRNAAGEPVELRVVFTDQVRTAPVSLVLETFRMAVFGDSILWGQGLEEHDKIDVMVEKGIQRRQGEIGVYRDNFAHSGAIIGFTGGVVLHPPFSALDGEIPTDGPTIFEQVDMLTSHPETVDLVLVDGGINDINFRNILKSTDDHALLRLIEKYCRGHMLALLRRVSAQFPAARVIVTGYYPIVSENSDPDPLKLAGLVQILAGGVIDPGVPLPGLLASNCRIFAEHSEKCLQSAVDTINRELSDASPSSADRVTLVVPPFGARNSVFAEEPWAFAGKLDTVLNPQDEVAQHRKEVCSVAPERRTNRWQCERASAGHPNKEGAKQYAGEILGALQPKSFPSGFLWGAATAAYQVEGGINNNDWHFFTTTRAIQDRARNLGKVVNLTVELQPADRAVQHGNIPTLEDDLDRARVLGMNAYRFSIEWSRIEPVPGRFDNNAFDYYDRAIAAMVARGLKPVVTLNHLTLPDWVLTPPAASDLLSRAVEDQGFKDSLRGWENDATIDAFEKFVEKIVARYKGSVDTWITLNEPVGSMIGIGYIGGLWSPGFSLEGDRGKRAYFNLLRAHVRAYDKIKEIYQNDPSQVGFAHAMMFCKVSQDGPGLLNEHARARDQFEYFMNWHILDSLTSGEVDTAIEYEMGKRTMQPAINFFDLRRQLWHPRLDFLGINYYRSTYVHAYGAADALVTTGRNVEFTGGKIDPDLANQPFGGKRPFNLLNDLGWETYPRGLYDIIGEVDDRFDGRMPILITENGTPEKGDRNRAAYTVAHLEQLARAVNRGSRITGYLHWSLVDNFEWQEGYRPEARFGLFTIDRTRTLERHITEGALAFPAAAKQNSVEGLAERFGRMTPHGFSVS